MKATAFLTSLGLCLLTAVSSFAADPVHVDAEAAAKLIEEKKVIVLDVRTPEEFAEGHIQGAENIDFTANDFEEKATKLDREKSYLVHCAAGGRSTNSLEVFGKLGFGSIFHLDGGFNGWTKAGKPVAK